MTGPLATVTDRAHDRHAAFNAYLSALLAARAAGHTYAAIAAAAGTTRQSVWETIRRHEDRT